MSTFNVQVPAGAPPGATIQVTAPSGTILQVQIPDGMTEGNIFAVQDPGSGVAPTTIGQRIQNAGMMNATQIADVPDDEAFLEAYVPLPDVRYDVTNVIESLCACVNTLGLCGWTTKTLLLNDQEVVYKEKNCCGTKVQKRPYAQIGSVDVIRNMCCVGLSSDFVAPTDKQKKEGQTQGVIFPGMGCDEQLVNQMSSELQSRKIKRGGIAQIKKLEFAYDKIINVARQLPIALQHFGKTYTPTTAPVREPPPVFTRKVFNVSATCEQLCCTFKELTLEKEEAILTINQCGGCNSITQKREYAQLGTVEMGKACIVCRNFNSDLTPAPISPGCGCDKIKVAQIVQEMRARMGDRGNIGQIRRQEKIFKQMFEIDKEMPLLLDAKGIAYPPAQETMSQMYPGGKAPEISVLQAQGVSASGAAEALTAQVETKTYDVTNYCESIQTMVCTCFIAGWTTTTMELKEDMMILTEKNNLDDLSIHEPYAQMGSVDYTRSCCCCYTVNEMSPACGCFNGALVEEISKELQERKVKRGNIAQVKQLEAMQSTAVELGVKMDMVMQQEAIQYPPSQEVIGRLYPTKTPRVLTTPPEMPHIAPTEKMERKTYDITDYVESTCSLICCPCAGWTSRTMELEEEEMHITTKNCCVLNNERTPYAQLGAVETETSCCICSELPEVAKPGCGCSRAYVEEIAGELQNRKVKRGNIAQLKMQENMLNEILKLDVKTDLLLDKIGKRTAPPAQEAMASVVVAPTS